MCDLSELAILASNPDYDHLFYAGKQSCIFKSS